MATISRLTVALTANSAQLVNELNRTNKSLGSWAAKARKQMNTVSRAGVAAAGAISAAFVAAVNKQAVEIDKLAKEAAKLGIDTSQLERLRYQAGLTGVSAEKLGMGMQRMTRRISEAAVGTGEAQKALKELGLDAKALNNLDAEQQFNAIAEAMKGVSKQSDRIRLTSKIFDSEGVALVNTFNSNLAETRAGFDALGVSVTSSQAAMVESFNDSKSTLGTIFDGFWNQVTIQVAPAFEMVVKWITASVKEFGGMGNVATKVVKAIAKGIGFISDVVYGLRLVIKNVQIFFADLWASQFELIDKVWDRYENFRKFLDDDYQKNDFFGGMAESFRYQSKQIRDDLKDLYKNGLPSDQIDAKFDQIQKRINAASGTSSKANDVQRNNLNALTKNTMALEQVGGELSGREKAGSASSKPAHLGFDSYLAALRREIMAGGSRQLEFARKAQHVLDGLAGRGENGLHFGGMDIFDVDGMQQALDDLKQSINSQTEERQGTDLSGVVRGFRDGVKTFSDGQQNLIQALTEGKENLNAAADQSKADTLGSIEFTMNSDGKKLTGILMGEPAFLRELKQFVDKSTRDSARAVA